MPPDAIESFIIRWENSGAAATDWSGVEPSIFGTLLTRALDPRERHKLGAEYTPCAYVERLIRPTIIESVRDEWRKSRKIVPKKEKKRWTSILKLKNKVHAFN